MKPRELPWVHADQDGGWRILLRVQPGARKDEICDLLQGRLKVRLAAPAVDGKANAALLEFIAKKLRIKKRGITLETGARSREKTLYIAAGCAPSWNGIKPVMEGNDNGCA